MSITVKAVNENGLKKVCYEKRLKRLSKLNS